MRTWEQTVDILRSIPLKNSGLAEEEKSAIDSVLVYIDFQTRTEEDAKNCPSFTFDVGSVGGQTPSEWGEKVLAWAKEHCNAEVYWIETPERKVTRPSGKEQTMPAWTSWGFSWHHGFISDLTPKKENEPKARLMAALFIYLWLKKVPVELARDLACFYANTFADQAQNRSENASRDPQSESLQPGRD